jgi:hypothetical protein
MTMFKRKSAMWVLAFAAVGGAAAAGAVAARGVVADTGILNETRVQDAVGEVGGGPDLSAVTITTYSDGTVSFLVTFANRDLLHPNETVQVDVDLNDDGNQDLNLSLWPTGEPSYLARWNGSDWSTVRQLPEVVQGNGSASVRLGLGELRDAAGVPIGSSIGVFVVTATYSGTNQPTEVDALPDDHSWIQHQIQPPAPPATTTTAATTTTTTTPPPASKIQLGKTVYLKRRTRTHNCTLGPLPDRRCSPGAYYSKLTRKVICSASFRTSAIRNVSDATRSKVEREYGLAAKHYGSRLEIDLIVSLELGGSTSIANLYPEEAKFANSSPGYRVKDKLENKLHDMVCAGEISLSSARRQIAADWEKLYEKVYGAAPSG